MEHQNSIVCTSHPSVNHLDLYVVCALKLDEVVRDQGPDLALAFAIVELKTDPGILQQVGQRVRSLEILGDEDQVARVVEVLDQEPEVKLTVSVVGCSV